MSRPITNPHGRSFLSYRRVRSEEAALLVQAQHDHGIPTWQDVHNLGSVPSEDEIRRVLADPSTSSAVLFITPEIEDSSIVRNVEIPKIIQRAEARDGFFVVPVAAGGLDYAKAAAVASNHLSAQNLADWNMSKIPGSKISPTQAAELAHRVLIQRIGAIHRSLPETQSLRLGLFVRRQPPFDLDVALSLNWFSRFEQKQAGAEMWQGTLLPALFRVAEAIRIYAPGRDVEAFGLPTLPAAVALGCAFLCTSGIRLSWKQVTTGQPDQLWSLSMAREYTGFTPQIVSKDPNGHDVAVLVSIADDTEPLFAAYHKKLPALRALVHIRRPGEYPNIIASPSQATDIAFVIQDGLRTARREYGNLRTVHMFMAAPAGLAVLVGQLLNTFGAVQTYEHVSTDGSECYQPAALLRPCT